MHKKVYESVANRTFGGYKNVLYLHCNLVAIIHTQLVSTWNVASVTKLHFKF